MNDDLAETVTDYMIRSARGRGYTEYGLWYRAAEDMVDQLTRLRERCALVSGQAAPRVRQVNLFVGDLLGN